MYFGEQVRYSLVNLCLTKFVNYRPQSFYKNSPPQLSDMAHDLKMPHLKALVGIYDRIGVRVTRGKLLASIWTSTGYRLWVNDEFEMRTNSHTYTYREETTDPDRSTDEAEVDSDLEIAPLIDLQEEKEAAVLPMTEDSQGQRRAECS